MMTHLQDPATLNTDDTPTAYRQPGVMRVLARELGAATCGLAVIR
ncbi:hypothetical protein [Mycobacteroides abscessus]